MLEMLIDENSKVSDVIEGPPGVEFLGEVVTTDLIDGEELASAIGLTEGTAQYTTEPWLHFVLDDVELYVAKKPYRHRVSWNHINAAGAVFGSSTVTINGSVYKVRLLKSAVGDVYVGNSGYDPEGAYDSEWNRLMYPIHSGNHTDARNPSPVSGEGIYFGTLAQYTDNDLVLHAGNGRASWCQETSSAGPTNRVRRGNGGVSRLEWFVGSSLILASGWRPVLELVG